MTAGDGMADDIAYRVHGAGPNLLLVSGLNGQGRFWDAVTPSLAERFRVLTYDQRGCGATPDDGADWSIGSLATDALALADAMFGAAPFAVIGHSTGGAIAQHMAATHPDRIRAVGLSGTWMQADAYMHALFGLRQALLARAPDLDPLLSNILRLPPEAFRPPDPHVALDRSVTTRRIDALIAHRGDRLVGRITAPALVIGAQDDRIVPPHLSVALHKALARSTLCMLDEGGHFFVQTQPQVFAGHVLKWLTPLLHPPHING
ncbi:alpha/beta fold hydrolase [Oceaniglobus indicus]|uniref:alpha/beta fold hydrolase n=1 Tax=Oceaniglobus indicus TaxID=2047749 RepID=UPI000C175464|nr:alpha/beta hydrolase [Oceaniglobus indicus]